MRGVVPLDMVEGALRVINHHLARVDGGVESVVCQSYIYILCDCVIAYV